ncbi:MAG: peptide chain release factor N(5)-glutamine methyltransferase [Bacteroidetes bacterium]|nr:peptide chain release factor N(5)-glutamine methyltransferase [Bacteroidota bacterium]
MKIASNKIRDILRFFREELIDSYEKDELESIIAYCFEVFLNMNRTTMLIRSDDTVTESELLKFNFAIKDLKKHKPIQYILGQANFYNLKFTVNEHVLIPRPETEELVHLIIKECKDKNTGNREFKILDIGTGSGCIPIALKKNLPFLKMFSIDISKEAIEVAEKNSKLNLVEVEYIVDSILQPKSKISDQDFLIDIIVSNPPYICLSEKENMNRNVVDHEPHLALFVEDNDPLLFYSAISDFALKHLNKNGRIYLEINQALGPETMLLFENKGFKNIELIKDISDNYRILRGNI